jgi:hypothetical protein
MPGGNGCGLSARPGGKGCGLSARASYWAIACVPVNAATAEAARMIARAETTMAANEPNSLDMEKLLPGRGR